MFQKKTARDESVRRRPKLTQSAKSIRGRILHGIECCSVGTRLQLEPLETRRVLSTSAALAQEFLHADISSGYGLGATRRKRTADIDRPARSRPG